VLSRYRHGLRAWTDPVGHVLFRLRLRPNHLTLCGLGVSVVTAIAFATGQPRTAGVLLILAGLFDYFDGTLARISGQVTPFGAFLDSVIDRYSDMAILLGILVACGSTGRTRAVVATMIALVGTVMVSYTKARAESIGVRCDVGFMERPERMICTIAGALFDLLEPAMWAIAVLGNATALHRIAYTYISAGASGAVPERDMEPTKPALEPR
jgi:CDP-diacylglycerol--glycerol-3-phosphate 3-phosphatidyltransferase